MIGPMPHRLLAIAVFALALAGAGLPVTAELTGHSFLPDLLGTGVSPRRYVFAERGWHWGPITRSDGLDFSRSVQTARYRYIYNALPGRPYTPVDMPGKEAWKAIVAAHPSGNLPPLHERLYFQNPRPLVELYDLKRDPHELTNLAGRKELESVEAELRRQLEAWMIREHDYLPLPTHALQNARR